MSLLECEECKYKGEHCHQLSVNLYDNYGTDLPCGDFAQAYKHPILKGQKEQDMFYMARAKESKCNSTCKKKQLGCLLVFKNMKELPVRGTNGPPFPLRVCDPCPRMECHNGEDYHLCRSVHAERQAILLAARRGQCTEGSTLYSYMGVPCKDCLLELVQAGVSEIVVLKETYHDELSKSILKEWVHKGGRFRVFDQEVW